MIMLLLKTSKSLSKTLYRTQPEEHVHGKHSSVLASRNAFSQPTFNHVDQASTYSCVRPTAHEADYGPNWAHFRNLFRLARNTFTCVKVLKFVCKRDRARNGIFVQFCRAALDPSRMT